MQIILTGHHLDITDSLRSYVNEKMGKLERHFDKVSNTHVILSVEKNVQKAEATVHMSGNDIFAEAHEPDMYASIDAMVAKLDRQVKKHQEKITNHLHHKNAPTPEIED
jgi:putative sigma-54 modulation protein